MIPFIARYVACVTHRRLYCKQFNVFGRFVDIILFKTVAKYVAGRLIRTSFGLFQDLASVFFCDMWPGCYFSIVDHFRKKILSELVQIEYPIRKGFLQNLVQIENRI